MSCAGSKWTSITFGELADSPITLPRFLICSRFPEVSLFLVLFRAPLVDSLKEAGGNTAFRVSGLRDPSSASWAPLVGHLVWVLLVGHVVLFYLLPQCRLSSAWQFVCLSLCVCSLFPLFVALFHIQRNGPDFLCHAPLGTVK